MSAWSNLLAQGGVPVSWKHDVVVRGLRETYQEVQVLSGIDSNGETMELWSSPNGRTWTIIVTDGVGRTRTVAFGTDLVVAGTAKPAPGAPR